MIIKINTKSLSPESLQHGCPWAYFEGESIQILRYYGYEEMEERADAEDIASFFPYNADVTISLTSPEDSYKGHPLGLTVVGIRRSGQYICIAFEGEAYILNEAGKTIDRIESVSQRMKVKEAE